MRSRHFIAVISIATGMVAATFAASADDSVVNAFANSDQWAIAGHDYGNTRFSPLKQINSQNASKLSLVYSFSLGSLRSNESSPIVIGNTLYVSSSWGPKYVYAIDAATGARKWTYEPEIPDDVLQYACCDVDNRGVTFADGKIFVGRLDGN
jgi:alcohol dehydrogenase (cytochrome c)